MNTIKTACTVLLLTIFAFSTTQSFAQSRDLNEIPEPLLPWVDWVLHGEEQIGCPYHHNSSTRLCAWPSRLTLNLNDQGGQFIQEWEIFSDALVQLPGDTKHWPLQVTDDGAEAILQSKGNLPYVRLAKGNHTLRGEFTWAKLPKTVQITPNSGLITLTVNGDEITQTQLNPQGQLWLAQTDDEKASEDDIDMQVFRRIVDGHPIQVETLIKLRVSGKQRSMALNSPLLDDFIASHINSDLPARLEGRNQLIVQLRPGEWSISVTGRAPADIQAFTMPDAQEPWPQQEVWVFVNDNTMRQVQVGGVNSIDPNQTRLPNSWKGLPAYLLTSQQTLSLDVKERGIDNLARNQLTLKREMWLDFDGNGYSIKDQLMGTINQSRVNVLANIELGRVSIDQQAQFITREADQATSGVEIRQKNLNLSAESRFTGPHSALPANGWALPLQQVDTQLHLPPGWRVLGLSGTDNLPNTWLETWSLLDLFLVMIIVMCVRHFYGWAWAGTALLTLLFTWQERNAPNLVWLNLLAITALLSVLQKGKYRPWLKKYRLASLGILAVILLGYVIDTIRVSAYPQLERGYTQQWQSAKQLEMDLQQPEPTSRSNAPMVSAVEEIVATGSRMTKSRAPQNTLSQYTKDDAELKQIDPNSMIQSGPGLPSWNGYRTLQLSWSGPVDADQTSRLIMLSPWANSLFNLLGIVLLLALSWCFVRTNNGDIKGDQGGGNSGGSTKTGVSALTTWFKRAGAGASLIVLAMLMLTAPDRASAQAMPSPALLDTLKQRLTETPECLGACAQIQRMSVNASKDSLVVRLRVHAVTDTAIPLPASQGTWMPKQILLNGEPAAALARNSEQVIWLSVNAGLVDVVLSGPMPQRTSFSLTLPLRPQASSWRSGDNSWSVDGIDANGVVNQQLQFSRILGEDDQSAFQTSARVLPTFVKVERQLRLGLDWSVRTTVRRVSPTGGPLTVTLPLLENEQPLGDELQINDGRVSVNLAADQATTSWSSKLNVTPELTLVAANTPTYLEIWSVDASAVWRVDTRGLPVNRYLNQGVNQRGQQNGSQSRSVPVWLPWPDETLRLIIERPTGVDGQTVTIQSSHIDVTTGKRASDVNLNLTIRSSRGVQHELMLPENAEVQELLVDGIKQRIQRDDNALSVMLKPGQQDVSIAWREPAAQALKYAFPAVDLGLPSVNAHTTLRLPRDRWVIWVNGPLLGPAILFWSVLGALLILSLALGWGQFTPLTTLQWFLLAIGLSQTSPALIAVVIACFIGLSTRDRLSENLNSRLSKTQFNLMQTSLIALIVASIIIILAAVANGLLGSPDMQIKGNGSSSYLLKWYQDRSTALLPQPEIISVPVWLYRVLMLVWATWLAKSLLNWIKWGWGALSKGEFWQRKSALAVGQVNTEQSTSGRSTSEPGDNKV